MPDRFERTCRYGHGPLTRLPEIWALPGVRIITQEMVHSDGTPAGPQRINLPTSRSFAVHLQRCPVCGYVELDDQEAPT